MTEGPSKCYCNEYPQKQKGDNCQNLEIGVFCKSKPILWQKKYMFMFDFEFCSALQSKVVGTSGR